MEKELRKVVLEAVIIHPTTQNPGVTRNCYSVVSAINVIKPEVFEFLEKNQIEELIKSGIQVEIIKQ